MKKVFLVRRGHICFNEQREFSSLYDELKWKVKMMVKGCKVRKVR